MADWDMWIRMNAVASGACIAEPLVEYTSHSGSMLLADGFDVSVEFTRFRAKHPEVEAAVLTFFLAMRHRRRGHRFHASWIYLREGVRHANGGLLLRAIAVLFGERAMRVGSRARTRFPK
jgi:hypothetical protein